MPTGGRPALALVALVAEAAEGSPPSASGTVRRMTQPSRFVFALSLGVLAILPGCGATAANYGVAADAQVALRSAREAHAAPLAVGQVQMVEDASGEDENIGCRALSVAAPADRGTFSEYVRRALIDELNVAGLYDPQSPIIVRVAISRLEITSTGNSAIDGTFHFSVGQSAGENKATHVVKVPFTSAFVADTACQNAAKAFPAAVQQAIVSFVRSPEFYRATAPSKPPRGAPKPTPPKG
jgi:hypothetical protein